MAHKGKALIMGLVLSVGGIIAAMASAKTRPKTSTRKPTPAPTPLPTDMTIEPITLQVPSQPTASMVAVKPSARLAKPVNLPLSKNFNAREFLVSANAPELANYPITTRQLENLKRLVTDILQPIRDEFNTSIHINSGLRPKDFVSDKGLTLNEILKADGYKPSDSSDHEDGSAADFTVANKALLPKIFERIQQLAGTRQVIFYINRGYIHVAVVTPNKSRFSGTKLAFVDSSARKKA